jgi:hypothetical protein
VFEEIGLAIFRGYFRVDLASGLLFAAIATVVATVVDITESQLRKYLMELIGIVHIPIKFFNYLLEALIFFWFTFRQIRGYPPLGFCRPLYKETLY